MVVVCHLGFIESAVYYSALLNACGKCFCRVMTAVDSQIVCHRNLVVSNVFKAQCCGPNISVMSAGVVAYLFSSHDISLFPRGKLNLLITETLS